MTKIKLVKQLMTGIKLFLRKRNNTVIPLTDKEVTIGIIGLIIHQYYRETI